MAYGGALFGCDVGFCSECGSLLPEPIQGKLVTCRLCAHSMQAKKYEQQEEYSSVVFNKYERKDNQKKVDIKKADGPLVDRKCSACGHEGMTYYTQQTRSADEGQTVFYCCPHCRAQEKEDS
ncbi:DNA-directed RNA polymerase I subunit RPA12-like [Sycon ciliatum]|uniref:DNA-directed RNA polymerase I subunit RPA12-like n=1 Tax=Sycon ciliatum TaxID=27933 RepID=UPI0031F654B2